MANLNTNEEQRQMALNLALMFQRQQDNQMTDEQVVKTAEKFRGFLADAAS